jgi:hypothetical protein
VFNVKKEVGPGRRADDSVHPHGAAGSQSRALNRVVYNISGKPPAAIERE